VRLNDALLEIFIRICGEQVRCKGEILLDLDSIDDSTHGQQQLSFFNGAYDQHMYHPMLVFERHTSCLFSLRLRPGNASSHARILPMLVRLIPRLEAAFAKVEIKLRGDAGFALPLLYDLCELSGLHYAFGIPANSAFKPRVEPWQKRLRRRYRRNQLPQR
jgi:Transposase DDE domain group 1